MKSRKLVKILGASGLAIMMGIGTLCGVLIAPMNSTHANTSANATTETALTPEAQAKAELDANILVGGGLGLDPENDPVIATTDWGLEIKFHNAGEYQGAGYLLSNPSTNGTVSTAALSGYLYFQGGTYNGVSNLKWVIIGYSTNAVTSTGPVKATNLGIPDTTDAGNALNSASSKGVLISTQYKFNAYTNAVGNAEIPAGCVLCISEKNLLNEYFNIKTYEYDASDGYRKASRWVYSDLRTTMSNLCNSGITGFDTIRAKIQTVSLNTYSYKYKPSLTSAAIGKDTSSDKFFALANSTYSTKDEVHYNTSTYPQNYRLETYLGYYVNRAKRISYTHNTTTATYWWLRSGYSSWYEQAYYVDKSGCVSCLYVDTSLGVRPAFVLKL